MPGKEPCGGCGGGEAGRAPAPETYRYFLRAAVLVGILAGAALGALGLTHLAAWGYTGNMPLWGWWMPLVQAHGDAQLFGWAGLFVIGIALHSLPRMLREKPLPPRWARAIFALVLGGLALGLVAQPLTAAGRLPFLFPLAMGLQFAGVSLFAGYVFRLARRSWPPYLGFVFAGTCWFWLGALARLWLSALAVAGLPPAGGNAAYLHAMTWGFLLAYLLGYSLRLLPAFVGLPAGHPGAAWAALGLVTLGAALEVVGRLANQALLSAAAMAVTAAGVAAALGALRIAAPPLAGDDAEGAWLRRFSVTAYGWLVVAVVLLLGLRLAEAAGPVSVLHQHAFGGASRHALTVGFVSLMIVGVASRILPLFSGAPRAPAALLAPVYGLLLAGCLLRVGGQVAAGLWGGGWYGVMGLSGWLELAGITLFGIDLLRLLRATPEGAALPETGAPVSPSLDAPVGPLVAHRPWLIPVFARHGMGQVSNPLFQRTVGQRVSVAQACRRFQVEPTAFVEELRAAEVAAASTGR